jgi:hypothetical protein
MSEGWVAPPLGLELLQAGGAAVQRKWSAAGARVALASSRSLPR